MIKGCNKRVIVMKDTGSEVIEEAFFILKPHSVKGSFSETEIMKHANSILEKSCYSTAFSPLSMNTVSGAKRSGSVSFLWGMALGVVFSAVIFLVL